VIHAKVEDHFKSARSKSPCSSIEGIDFTYVINLDQRPEKFQSCQEQLHPYGIRPYRFSAVNGWELSLEQVQDLGIIYHPSMAKGGMGTSYISEETWEPCHSVIEMEGKSYFSHCMSRGAIGIVLSHLSVLQDAFDSGYETIWVMEDDIEVLKNPHTLSHLIKALDEETLGKGWDILFTDRDTKDQNGQYVSCFSHAWRPNFTPKNPTRFAKKIWMKSFIKTYARYGAYSMIIRRSGMEKILKFFKRYKLFLPYDMDIYLSPNLHMYTVIEDIVSTQARAPSDNGGPNYLSTQ
jgi:GR25 family glycosyltransferase involved in LPS biosynthesis